LLPKEKRSGKVETSITNKNDEGKIVFASISQREPFISESLDIDVEIKSELLVKIMRKFWSL